MQPPTEGLNLMRVLMLPHKMAKYYMIGEQVSKKEKGPGPSFSPQTVPVVAKMLPWQLTLLWYEHQLTRVEPFPSPPPTLLIPSRKPHPIITTRFPTHIVQSSGRLVG